VVTDELAWTDATGQAELVRQGEITPSELVEAAITRVEQLNPQLNAVIHSLADKARAAAADPQLPDGPFRGVPFLVKDGVCHTAGDPFHCGMQALKELDWHEDADTWLAQRYRAAGFVFVGKTNLPELATSITTEPRAYGATRNPWDVTRSPAGSSGGAGAAVASGMVAVAHGNDMGGSIRAPSSACGLVGLKPTRGRTTLGPDFGEFWGPLTHEHVLVRSVRDSARVLDAVCGPGPGDPYTAPAPIRPYADEVGADPGPLRIGVRTARPDGTQPDPECVAAVESAAKLLEELGHEVNPVPMAPLDDQDNGFVQIFTSSIARDLERWSARTGRTITPADVEPWNGMCAEVGASVTALQYHAAVEAAQAWSRRVCAWWAEGNDVLITPTMGEVPPLLGHLGPEVDTMELMGRMGAFAAYTGPFNVTGQPAMSLPLHWSANGLPVGVQFVGAYGREDVLFRLAGQLEQARPWADRRPSVSAA